MFIDETKVFYKENFLTEKELKYLEEIIEAKKDAIDAMSTSGAYQTIPIDSSKFVKNLSYRVNQLIADNYGPESVSNIYPRDEIQFLNENSAMDFHDDAEGQNVSHAAVIYISGPEDYDGGELVYPKLDLQIKPEKGSIAIHPREPEYTHGVTLVTRGRRYVLVMFAS
jgi:hypothetical protein